MNRDYRINRVRLITNKQTNKVSVVPRCGWMEKIKNKKNDKKKIWK